MSIQVILERKRTDRPLKRRPYVNGNGRRTLETSLRIKFRQRTFHVKCTFFYTTYTILLCMKLKAVIFQWINHCMTYYSPAPPSSYSSSLENASGQTNPFRDLALVAPSFFVSRCLYIRSAQDSSVIRYSEMFLQL